MGGGDRETDIMQDSRENSSVDDGTLSRAKPTRRVEGLKTSVGRRHALGRLSGDACRREDGLNITAGGAVSFAPPHTPTPKPSTTSRIGRGGGCKPAYGTLGRGTRRGNWSAGAGGLVALRRTDDERDQTLEGGG